MARGRRSTRRQVQEQYTRNQGENRGLPRINGSWRSEDREETDEFNQPLNLSILARTLMASRRNDVDATWALGPSGYNEVTFNSDCDGIAWDLGNSKTGRSYINTWVKKLSKHPGIKYERLNPQGLRLYHTLDCDLFNNMDLVHKLQNCRYVPKADAVASEINTLIERDGVENLPSILGRGLLP